MMVLDHQRLCVSGIWQHSRDTHLGSQKLHKVRVLLFSSLVVFHPFLSLFNHREDRESLLHYLKAAREGILRRHGVK